MKARGQSGRTVSLRNPIAHASRTEPKPGPESTCKVLWPEQSLARSRRRESRPRAKVHATTELARRFHRWLAGVRRVTAPSPRSSGRFLAAQLRDEFVVVHRAGEHRIVFLDGGFLFFLAQRR